MQEFSLGFIIKLVKNTFFRKNLKKRQRAAFRADGLGKTRSGKEPAVVEPRGVPGVEGTGWTGNLGEDTCP